MRHSTATPVSSPETVSSKQLITNDLTSIMVKKDYLFFKVGSSVHTMIDVVQTPQGALVLTQPTSDGKGELLKSVTHDLLKMDGQPLFVEAESEVYEVTSIKENGKNLECTVNSRPVSFASRRKQVAMFVDNI